MLRPEGNVLQLATEQNSINEVQIHPEGRGVTVRAAIWALRRLIINLGVRVSRLTN